MAPDILNADVVEGVSNFLTKEAIGFVKGLVVAGVTLKVAQLYARYKAHGAISKYRYPMLTPHIQETFYWPSEDVNPDTGQNYWDQQIIGVGKHVALKDIFVDEHDAQILNYLTKAFKRCCNEKPIVFQHLQDVVHEKDYDAVMNALATQWQNYFSAHFNVKEKMPNHKRGGDQRPVCRLIFPLLTHETGEAKTHSRIIILYDEFTNASNIPKKQNVRFDIGAGEYQPFDPDRPHSQVGRYDANVQMAEVLSKPENDWMRRMFGILVPTGELEDVPGCSI